MSKKNLNKATLLAISGIMAASSIQVSPVLATDNVKDSKEQLNKKENQGANEIKPKPGYTFLSKVSAVPTVKNNVVTIDYVNGEKAQITFLENGLFRFNMEPDGKASSFKEYAEPNSSDHKGTIVQQNDKSSEYSKPTPTVSEVGSNFVISTSSVKLLIDKETSMMTLTDASGKVYWKEAAPLQYKNGNTIQTLVENENENFYGGGTQNGRFAHKGTAINIANTNNWVDGGVASPNPFYWSTNGYGVVRNTFKKGVYDFGSTRKGVVETSHTEKRFDAYYFVGNTPTQILDGYFKVTGNPALFPENSFYMGHLNCYNRDEWTPNGNTPLETVHDKNKYKETNNKGQIKNGGVLETLNGEGGEDKYKFSARAVIDQYEKYDMPMGWFLPNDGYGCGYGQSDTNLDDNVDNLKQFTNYAQQKGVNTGLWTQSNLTPNPSEPIHLQRDFKKEVKNGGIRTLKTDVAWVGSGYSFGLNGIKTAYDIISETKDRPTIVTLDGWGGTQRYGGIWTGDQTGGNWEYIRFHIPTYIGQSLSGNPNVSSDVDGIFGGDALIQTRDIQWKSFTTMMLDMDGWGSYPKKPYVFGEDITSINRMYLKLRAQLMPYIYSTAYTSANLGSGEEKGKPQVRAMFLEFPNDPNTYGKNVQYQFMMGKNLLVAPVYQNTAMQKNGDDVRNGIYLPDEKQVWIDYFTGKQYQGGKTLNNFDAPIWKLPLFVKNGAILPMYEENNNAMPKTSTNKKGLDKTKRIVEFYPDATKAQTDYTLYEDDGKSIDNTNIEQPTYSSAVTTHFTSKVANGNAVLTAEKSNGTYTGYDSNRDTTFVVNVSKEPTDISAKIGSKTLDKSKFKVVNSQEEFDKATGNVYFYNAKPNLNKYATKDSEFAKKEIATTPKLFVKFEKTDVNNNAIELTVKGFENDGKIDKNEVNKNLSSPTGLAAKEDTITPTSIKLTWNKVENATGYELETDGVIQTGINATEFNHVDLNYHSKHTYRIRAINKDGHSAWSQPLQAQSALDPYRNVPKNIELKWSHGDQWGALKNALDFDYNTMFHSTDNAIGKDFIMDMKKVYQMDRFEYTPRQDNKGNGTVKKMDVYTSVDGNKWELAWDSSKHDAWTYSTNPAERDTKTIEFKGKKARYIKLVVRDSVGGFFSAAELQPYIVDGTTGIVPGDTNNDGVVDVNDLTQIENYVGLEKGDATWDQVQSSDWNDDGYYDAYDIAYTTTRLNGGISKKSGNPEGTVKLVADKNHVKAGESVTIDLYGVGMKNVYAFGLKLPYNSEDFKYNKAMPSLATLNMKQFAFDREAMKTENSKGNRNANLVFTNVGDQSLIQGTQSLGTVSFTANKDMDITDQTFAAAQMMFVGNNNSQFNTDTQLEEPTIPNVSRVKIQSNEMKVTGQDEKVLQAGMGVDKLVDGKWGTDANRFEFKWGNTEAEVPARLPYYIKFEFKKARKVDEVKIYLRHAGNVINVGALKDFDLYAINGGKEELINSYSITKLDADGSYTIKFNSPKTVDGFKLNAKTSQAGQKFKLNIDEVEFYENSEKAVEDVVLDEKNPKELYIGRIVDFTAKVTPDDATNKYYEVTSSDPDTIEVIKTVGTDGVHYALKGRKAGVANITVTSKGHTSAGKVVSKTTEVKVVDRIYFDDLNTLIEDAKEATKYPNLYVPASLEKLQAELKKAEALKTKEGVTQAEVNNQMVVLYKTIAELEYKGSNDAQPDSNQLIVNKDMKVEASTFAAESPVKNVIDGNINTFWHSNYSDNKVLPEHITVDLGASYQLSQVNYLPRQDGSHNGDITKYKVEISKDGKNFIPVVIGTFANDGNSILDRNEYKKVKFDKTEGRFVRFTALESLGDSVNAYASAAELQFFGVKAGEQISAEDIVLDVTEITGMKPGQTKKINASIKPMESTDTLTWTSSDPKVATVDAQGNVTAVAAGEATITVSANANVKKDIKVTVEAPEKDNLTALIEEAKHIKYTNEAIQNALNEAIQKAEKAVGADKETVQNAYYELAGTMSELEIIKKDLEAVTSYANIDLSKYEDNKAKTEYKELIKQVSEYAKDPVKNKQEISKLRKELDKKYKELVELQLDQLTKAIELAKKVDLNAYVDDAAKEEFVNTLKVAQTLKPKTNAEIDSMVDKLSSSLKKLSVKATDAQMDSMKDLQSKLEAMKKENFSAENKEKINQALKDVEAAIKDNNLSQEDADKLIRQLEEVLKLKPEESNGETNHKPSDSNGTIGGNDKPSNNGNDDTVIVNPSQTPDSNSTTPSTGVETQAGKLAGFMLIGGLGAWLASRKRKGEQK